MKKFQATIFGVAVLAMAFTAAAQDYRAQAVSVMKHDFHAKGIAHADRLNEDALAARVQPQPQRSAQDGRRTPAAGPARGDQYPADGQVPRRLEIGREDRTKRARHDLERRRSGANGGSCYNCHQIGPSETSFGTIGNSLRQVRQDPRNTPAIQKYVYGKIYNAKAFSLCSKMPRFGHSGTLTEQQIKDLVALLAPTRIRRQQIGSPAREPARVPACHGMAAACGLPLAQFSGRAHAQNAAHFYDLPRFGSVHFLHFHRLPRAADAAVVPRAECESRDRGHGWPPAAPGRRGALRHFGISRSAEAHAFTSSTLNGPAKTYGKVGGFAPSDAGGNS